MKSNTTVLNAITNDYHVDVGTVLHAEWPMSRLFNTIVDNTPSEDDEAFDIEYFPIESITEPNRPTSGICKAVVGQASVEPRYHATVPAARYYTVDAEDEYQYWQSPVSAAADGTFPLFDATNFPQPTGETYAYDSQTAVRPQVTYSNEDDENGNSTPITVTANKITFTVENTFAYPTQYDVQVKYTTIGEWVTVGSNFAIPTNGKVELWYNGTNWTTAMALSSQRTMSAVRLVIRKMNKEAFFNLIELGLCLERDLTADLVNWNDSFSMGESDFITPLGQISSNTAQVTLWNGDEGTYRNNNAQSPYYQILDKGVILTCWTKTNGVLIQEFEMFSDTWDEADDQTTIQLVDGSGFFMETKPRPVLYQNIPVQEAIWRICDIVGFTNYEVTTINEAANIDIFWTDGDKTAWEIFGELSRATQTAIFFDSFGTLQVKTRDAAWDNTKTVNYSFTRDSAGSIPASIVTLSESTEYEANKVSVNWQPTGFSEQRDNIVPFEVVWEPDGDVVLRSTELSQNLLKGDTVINLKTREGQTWPWSGMMNVEGEWISFDAKRYVYYDGITRIYAWVEDYDAQKKLDAKGGDFYRHKNHYTGTLRVEQRGIWGTEEVDHRIDLGNWTRARQRNYTTNHSPCSGIKLNGGSSSVTISAPKNSNMNDYTYLARGNGVDQGSRYIGARLKIDKTAHEDKVGGIFFAGDGGYGSGYYLEIMATSKMEGSTRKNRNEVMFYSMKPDGSKKIIGGETVKMRDKSKDSKGGSVTKKDIGARLAVPADRYIDFDIWYVSANNSIQVFANGRRLFSAAVPFGWTHGNVSLMGLYARGHSQLTFDYFYAINSTGVEMIDSESYYDRIEDGYYSSQAKDWTYDTRNTRRRVKKRIKKRRKGKKWKWVWKKYQQKYKQRFYDDFGPMAHEVREFDVKFADSLPVLQSKLYFSNETQAVCTEFVGDISGATFVMANTHREPAIINGDDERTSQGNGAINHKLFVYGRPVIQKDSQTIEKEDGYAIRRRGPIEVEYDSPWIQNEEEAERFATWLTTHWSRSDSTLQVEVFGNPLIELTDIVRVTYSHIDSYFYVTGVSNSYDAGLTTNLTLRKAANV